MESVNHRFDLKPPQPDEFDDPLQNSNLHQDSKGLEEHKGYSGAKPTHEGHHTDFAGHATEEYNKMRGWMSQQIPRPEECGTVPQYIRKENSGMNGFENQETNEPRDCGTILPQHIMEEGDEKRGFMSQMARTEECDLKLLSTNKRIENYVNSDLMCQETIKLEECNTKLPQCPMEDSDEKRGLTSQVIQQIAENEDYATDLPQNKKGDSDEKHGFASQKRDKPEDSDMDPQHDTGEENDAKIALNSSHQKQGKYFYYDPPLHEETGVWIPVSVPPMSESEHEEWTRGFSSNGGAFPEGDMGWNQVIGEDKELTMWDVVVEMLLVARRKVSALNSSEICNVSWLSSHLIEQAWKEMAQTLTEANLGNIKEILETEPPKWLPDSAASACMLCSVRFHPIMCTRHHCRFCGGVFCSECTKGRSLLPAKFRIGDPQRVCDVCCVRLESVQPHLMDQVSRAAQLPTHDLTDLSTLRSWLNFPWGQTMEYEIYKAANTIKGYNKVGSLRPEKSIPEAILREAKGLAVLTVMKVGMMVTYNIGTGLVVRRREDGSWSPPSAISSFGVGWGAQAGGELIDLIIVLRSNDAIRTFSGDMHLSVGAGLSAAVGVVGRIAEADVRAGTGGYAACYTYSCSKGAFIGCSLEGSVVTTRARENSRFYGSHSVNASDILLGSLPRPPAASILYRALADLYQKLEV